MVTFCVPGNMQHVVGCIHGEGESFRVDVDRDVNVTLSNRTRDGVVIRHTAGSTVTNHYLHLVVTDPYCNVTWKQGGGI